MSTLKVNTIESETPTVNIADGLNVTGVSTVANITATTLTSTNIVNATSLSHRNLIINGAMQVAQRGVSSNSSGYTMMDRFPVYLNGADENPTHAQVSVDSGTTPYTLGFRTALKITNGNQTSGAGSNDYVWIQQKIEAQNISQSGWNYTSASSYITLSFWVRSSVAQTFKGYIETIDGTAMQYPFETGSLSANTWTKITKTIPGHANLSFDTNNGEGFKLSIIPMMGTDKTSNSVTEDAWGTYTSSARIKDVTTTWYTTNDATFELTGVQLEVGSQATAFEHRSYGEELALCQRYCVVDVANRYWYNGHGGNVYDYQLISFPVTMRADPTLSFGTSITLTNVNTSGGDDGTGHGSFDVRKTGWQYSPLANVSGNITGKTNYTASAEL